MGITHVVRGEEWISSTPKHLLLYRWLGFDEPAFAHMPLLRNTDKSKISKRKNPAARLTWFVEQGYLPEALLNFLGAARLRPARRTRRSSPSTQFSASFEWSRVNTVGPVFDLDKLDWLNGHYMRGLDADDFARRLVDARARSPGSTADAGGAARAARRWCRSGCRPSRQGVDMLRVPARRRRRLRRGRRRPRPSSSARPGSRCSRPRCRRWRRSTSGRRAPIEAGAARRAGRRARPQAAQRLRAGAGRGHRAAPCRRRCSSRWSCSAGNGRWPGSAPRDRDAASQISATSR